MQPQRPLAFSTKVLIQAHELQKGDKILSPAGKELTVIQKTTVVRNWAEARLIEVFVNTMTNTRNGWKTREYQFEPKDLIAIQATEDDYYD